MSKVCLRCEETKPISEFSKNKNRKDGLQAYCKPCTRSANQASEAKNRSRPVIEIPTTKVCKRCDQTKSASDFFKDSRRPDGLYASCKSCHTERTTSWKKRNPHVEKVIRKRSYDKHSDSRREYTRKWRSENTERARQSAALWKLNNRARATALELTRTRRSRNAPGQATAAKILARWEYYGGKCWMCSAPAEHIDHVKPLAKGGSNWPANLRPACAPCNLRKRDAWPLPAA